MNTIDCRGLSCPAPVITVKKALEEQNELCVMLDDGAPRENVTRFARNRGYQVAEMQQGKDWTLTISVGKNPMKEESPRKPGNSSVLLITSNQLGDGAEELGKLLMRNFIHTLLETSNIPECIFFVNSAVFLATEGSDVLEALEKLNKMGTEIFSCGLCLDYYGLKDKLKAGATTNMLTIADNLLSADRVIRL